MFYSSGSHKKQGLKEEHWKILWAIFKSDIYQGNAIIRYFLIESRWLEKKNWSQLKLGKLKMKGSRVGYYINFSAKMDFKGLVGN